MKKFVLVLVVLVLVYAVCALVFFEKETFTVSFETMGGVEIEDMVFEDDSIPDVTPVKEGYTFSDWYFDEAYTLLADELDNETTLYAKWEVNSYYITYVSNKPSDAWGSVVGNMAVSTYTYNVAGTVKTNEYTLAGWTFAGWNTSATGSGEYYEEGSNVYNLFSTSEANLNLYATWIASEYTITFEANCPAEAETAIVGTMNDIDCVYDVSIYLPTTTYVLDHWAFTGWNTAADGSGDSYSSSVSLRNLTDVDGGIATLYAMWTPVVYTVSYDKNTPETASNGIVGEMLNTAITYNTESVLAANAYELVGWTFLGWNTAADGSGLSYADGTVIALIIETNVADIELYAIWEANTYTVVYDVNTPEGYSSTGDMANSQFTYDTENLLDSNAFNVNGFIFIEWNTMADGSGTSYANGQDMGNAVTTAGGTLVLYAIWEDHGYTVVYDANTPSGAEVTGSMENSIFLYSTIDMLDTIGYTVDGWEFIGWSLSPDSQAIKYTNESPIYNLPDTLTDDTLTLYAVWVEL